MKRLLIQIAIVALPAVFTACGSSPTVGSDDQSASNDDAEENEGDSGVGPKLPDGGFGEDGQQQFIDDSEEECKPVDCDDLGADCGAASDGCGGLLDCGECNADEECGILEHNVCTNPDDICEPLTKKEACDGKECGTTGDGCGGGHDCGSCGDGEACGVDEAFQCGNASAGGACEAAIESCEGVGAECGQIGDGCGGMLDCDAETGGCPDGQFCGLGGPDKCGDPADCTPLTVAEACEGKCGFVSNGCGAEVDGGLIECPGCADGEACGAGGVVNVCGSAEDACVPTTEAAACGTRECGAVSDGCAGSHVCGACQAGEVCRNGACGPPCEPTPQTTACEGNECGLVSDGCGGSYDCGACPDGETCGVLEAFQCDVQPPVECVPLTPDAACADRECGIVFDGCGSEAANMIDCGALNGPCPDGEYCGVVQAFQCDPPPGAPECEATTCAALGFECGFALDECGNVYDCSAEGLSCDGATETCVGGIDGPAVCLSGGTGPGASCEVCDSIPDCSAAAQETRLTGRVITPGRTDGNTANQVGVPNAFVYILQTDDETVLPDIDSGIPSGGTACDRCADQDLGPVLVGATTDPLGNYTLEGNIPVDREFVLVVKIGKFRRAIKYTIASGNECTDVAVGELDTRLPRDMSDGLMVNIPRIAITTGEIDAMECVFEKMGIATSEFSEPGDTGESPARIHLYGYDGARMSTGATDEDDLHTDMDRIMSYDMLVFDCQGGGYPDYDQSDPRIREYVNRGGRMFASHYSYKWIQDNGNAAYDPDDPYNTGLAPSATWDTNAPYNLTLETGLVSVGRPNANDAKIQNFADWLVNEGAATENGGDYEIDIIDPRDSALSVGAGSEEFIYREMGGSETSVQQYAFNTPYGAPEEAICGRVAFSAFHVSSGGDFSAFADSIFPDHCDGTEGLPADLTDQEKVLLYMLFDLGSCVTTGEPEPPPCTPVTDCTGRCGNLPNGCGGIISCTCPDGVTCQSGGLCGIPECVPTTCADEGATCGIIADGCGGTLNCGVCPEGQACGLVTANQCTITCTPNDIADACDGVCGFASDGCGGVHECPGCDGSLTCIAGLCSDQTCVPQACPAELECGVVSDGCDGTASCGTCTLPEVCGGGGQPNVCGVPNCPALECNDLSAECGWIGDGCGGAVDCGQCPAGQVCQNNTCSGCQPRSCQDAGAECGAIGDGCGNIIECGDCPSGETCGVQAANQCGPPGNCKPMTCGQAAAECGLIGDGCGDTVDCGECPPGKVCGIEEAFKCGDPPPCVPDTCMDLGAECGAVANGCGGLLDCGPCGAGETCGLNEPNKCGSTGTAK